MNFFALLLVLMTIRCHFVFLMGYFKNSFRIHVITISFTRINPSENRPRNAFFFSHMTKNFILIKAFLMSFFTEFLTVNWSVQRVLN